MNMKTHRIKQTLLALLISNSLTGTFHAQSPEDTAAIKATALDYIEGWYDGNAERMQRALHPDLAKRIVTRKNTVNSMTAQALAEQTRNGGGKNTPPERQQKDVTILDVFEKSPRSGSTTCKWERSMIAGSSSTCSGR